MPQASPALPLRVLYIEDNELVREITCELLADEAREVVAVATGEEALSVFQQSRFDLVVTDVSLPTMSGIDLVREVKRIAPSMPVVLASGYPIEPADWRLGPQVRTIVKPFDADQMNGLIRDLCPPLTAQLP
jgi:two-component system, cell cycle response regulator CpdR